MSPPRLTICIPTFNRLGYLQQAVHSALAQTEPGVQVLIGDDGDSFELRSWCTSFAEREPRIRYIKTPRRLGLAGNWNFLAAEAGSEFITLIGDDDRLLPTFAETLLNQAADGADVVFCNHHIIDGGGLRLQQRTREFTERYGRAALAPGPVPDPYRTVWQGSVAMSASIIRTAAVRRHGFKEDINTPELELFVRMVASGASFVFVDAYLAEYRVHEASATTSGLTIDRLAEYLERIEVPPEVEANKRACLEPLLVGGVGVRLARGDVRGARALHASRYYPTATNARLVAKRMLLMLPGALVGPAYTSLRRIDRALRRTGA